MPHQQGRGLHVQLVNHVEEGSIEALPLRPLSLQGGIDRKDEEPQGQASPGRRAHPVQAPHSRQASPRRAARARRNNREAAAAKKADPTGPPMLRMGLWYRRVAMMEPQPCILRRSEGGGQRHWGEVGLLQRQQVGWNK